MKIKADLHTHSIASGHAYSTIDEMALTAKKKGLKIIGLTDHGPAMPDGPHEYYFYNLRALPEKIHGVRILKGIEANIISKKGELDLETALLASYEVVIASAHIVASPEGLSKKATTKMYIDAIANPHIDIIGHLENPQFNVNFKEVVGAAKENNTLIEINNASFGIARHGSYNNCIEIMKLIRENNQTTVVNSDAHAAYRVGEVDKALATALEVGIKKEQILNLNHKKVAEFLKIKL